MKDDRLDQHKRSNDLLDAMYVSKCRRIYVAKVLSSLRLTSFCLNVSFEGQAAGNSMNVFGKKTLKSSTKSAMWNEKLPAITKMDTVK